MNILLSVIICFTALSTNPQPDPIVQHLEHQEYERAYQLALQKAEQNPDNPENLLTLGFMAKKLNQYYQAIAIYEHARPFIKQRSTIERALSGAYLALGDLEHGWPSYEYRWVNPPPYNQELKNYLARGGSLHNKIVVLKTEYGLGDTLQFIRYAQMLKDKGARVIIESQKPLIPLLCLCPYIDEIHPQGAVIPAHFFALLMSLPLIMNTTMETISNKMPYLYADPALIELWKPRMLNNKKLRIGICWQADTHAQSNNQTVIMDAKAKSISLKELAPIADIESVQLYSLQKVNGLDQLQQANLKVIHFDDLDTKHGPFMDTAALIKNLDLVITIDTSIAHLAGGLGVPCWLLLNYGADWRWMVNRNDSPWYPTMKLFRQKKPGEWNGVIEEVKNAIHKLDDPSRSANL